MTTPDQWPLDAPEHLAAALREHDLPPEEAGETADALLRLAAWRAPQPSPAHVDRVVASLAALMPAPRHRGAGLAGRVARGWGIASRQVRLIHPAVWLGSALALAGVALYAAAAGSAAGARALAFAVPLVAAGGAAFLYGAEADPALEVALATPTSPRGILLSRVALVFGWDLLLALGASALVGAAHHTSIGSLAALWVGPAALLSSGSLLLSVLAGPLVAGGSTLAGWLAQAIQIGDNLHIRVALVPVWQTTPLTLSLAAILLLAAVCLAPRRERFTPHRVS
jgi:hypothetical protein